jgi:hypothetical protein
MLLWRGQFFASPSIVVRKLSRFDSSAHSCFSLLTRLLLLELWKSPLYCLSWSGRKKCWDPKRESSAVIIVVVRYTGKNCYINGRMNEMKFWSATEWFQVLPSKDRLSRWRSLSSGLLHRVVGWEFADVSEALVASIIKSTFSSIWWWKQ